MDVVLRSDRAARMHHAPRYPGVGGGAHHRHGVRRRQQRGGSSDAAADAHPWRGGKHRAARRAARTARCMGYATSAREVASALARADAAAEFAGVHGVGAAPRTGHHAG